MAASLSFSFTYCVKNFSSFVVAALLVSKSPRMFRKCWFSNNEFIIVCRSMFCSFSLLDVINSRISVQFRKTSIIFSFLDPISVFSVSNKEFESGLAPRSPDSF